MIKVKPFNALRPKKELASQVAALPYDVMSSSEAREMVKGNEYTFLRIDRAEVNLEKDVDIYSDRVYNTAKEMLQKFENDGIYVSDTEKRYYF